MMLEASESAIIKNISCSKLIPSASYFLGGAAIVP